MVQTDLISDMSNQQGWKRMSAKDKKLISYSKGGTRIDVWPKTMTVVVFRKLVNAPKKQEIFRTVSEAQLLTIFTNYELKFVDDSERLNRVALYIAAVTKP